MRKFARIENNRVVEIFNCSTDISSMFHPALIWVDVSSVNSVIGEGWTYDGSAFSPPPHPGPAVPPTMIDDIHKQLIALAAQVEAIKQSGSRAAKTEN